MEKQTGFLQRLTEAADLQDEPIPGLPLIEIAGSCRVLIENHCGVIEYGCNQIGVKVKYGEICIIGNNLVLKRMTKQQLIISGSIGGIRLIRGRRC